MLTEDVYTLTNKTDDENAAYMKYQFDKDTKYSINSLLESIEVGILSGGIIRKESIIKTNSGIFIYYKRDDIKYEFVSSPLDQKIFNYTIWRMDLVSA